jgi:hypothetical protein
MIDIGLIAACRVGLMKIIQGTTGLFITPTLKLIYGPVHKCEDYGYKFLITRAYIIVGALKI